VLIYANNINFRNTPMRDEFQKYIDKPVFLENDANCAAYGESIAGAAKGIEHSAMVTLGTGIGGGLIINGKIFSGFNCAGAELGHTVIASGGDKCTCGRKGCWEAYASASALIRATKKAAEENPSSLINSLIESQLDRINAKTVFDAAKLGDAVAKRIVDQYIVYLGEGIVNIINAFQPEVVVIGGGVSNEGEYLLQPLREFVEKNRYTRREVPSAVIKRAELGNDAGIIGAALLDS
ncbi:MAG: ROK family protein, partial [Eubacteriales bacterium]|nr:ROK family protein [Eubacteriales bacterium]